MNKNVFLCDTKNLNWEILTKNPAAFKKWDGVKDEKFLYYGGFTEKSNFYEGRVPKKPYIWGELPKMGGFDSFQI